MIDATGSDCPDVAKPDLTVDIGGLRLASPVVTASGTFGFGKEYEPFLDLSRLGAIVVKGLTVEPRAGNSGTRICETPSGLLNCIGLQNPGVNSYIDHEWQRLRELGTPVIVNVSGAVIEDYVEVSRRLSDAEAAHALEVNISCPNVKKGGMAFGTDPSEAARVVAAVRAVTDIPLIVKLSPNVSDVGGVARAVEDAGADALSLINTVLGMVIDVDRQRPVLGVTFGGLSGPAVRPIAVRMVWQAYEAVRIPIIGMGGIQTGRDAVQFMLAGAEAVAVGTGGFRDPECLEHVLDGITEYLVSRGYRSSREIVGLAHGG